MLTTTATRRGTSGCIAPNCAALIAYRQQQTRTFKFARIWASYFDHEPHRGIFRHHRKLRHTYAESLNRRLSWDNHPYADDLRRVLKSSSRECWRPRPSCRHVNTGAKGSKTPDNPTGVRPGNNIEDAERGAMEHLLFGDRATEEWPSTFRKFKRRTLSEHTASPKSTRAPVEEQVPEVEYIIDPITNRKMPKAVAEVPDVSSPAIFATGVAADTPVKGYQPQFTPFHPPASDEPIFFDGPPPEAELRKYGPVKLDPHASLLREQPSIVFESEEYESHHAKGDNQVRWAGDSITRFDGAIHPGAFVYQGAQKDVNVPPTAQEQPYDDLQEYKPVGMEEDVKSDESQQYPDLDKYKKVEYLESDGKPVAEKHTDTTSEDNYQPFGVDQNPAVYDEPQVTRRELNNYEPFAYNEPDGKPVTAPKEEHGYDPAEVRKYQAFRYNEPDGKPTTIIEEGSASYDPAEVQSYEPFRWNEPDGKPAEVIEEGSSSYDPAEVQSYQIFRWNEPDGKPAAVEEKYGYESAKTHEYQETSNTEPNAITAKEDRAAEAQSYSAVRHNEPNGKPSEHFDGTAAALAEYDTEQAAGRRNPYLEPTEEERAEDLDLLRASDIRASFIREPAEAKPLPREYLESAMSRLAADSDAQDQEAAAAIREAKQRTADQNPKEEKVYIGNYVRDFPEEFAKSWTSTFTPEDMEQTVQPALDRSTPLQPALNRQAKLSPRPAVGDPFSKKPQGLETSYEKECAADLDKPIFVKQYGEVPQETAGITSEANAATSNTISSPGSKPSISATATVEPTLYKILAYDPSTQSVSTATTTSHTSSSSPPLTPAEVLTSLSHPAKFTPHFGPLEAEGYEIVAGGGDVLVFRKVRTPSPSASPSTTAKKTAAAPLSTATATEIMMSASKQTARINPIDKTGSPPLPYPYSSHAVNRFASPTGFVNYDDHVSTSSSSSSPPSSSPYLSAAPTSTTTNPTPAARFVSGIDVRRQEPVFSGQRTGKEGGKGRGKEQKKAKSLGKRMVVGAAWVAAVSYALGVLGEYFATGGVDGLGPRGF
ncbi:hypothetical protein GE09DRAFT_1191447 [Coniochaeta sp. 2T2.1]|nr:hypothetical protein GE09DRAFT_1191447 [Coniochaeta sp. 2T2.1]